MAGTEGGDTMKPAWSRSKTGEVIGALWIMVALLAHHEGVRWLMWVAGIQGGLSTLAAIVLGWVDRKAVTP